MVGIMRIGFGQVSLVEMLHRRSSPVMRSDLKSWIIYIRIRNLSKAQREYPARLSNANVSVDQDIDRRPAAGRRRRHHFIMSAYFPSLVRAFGSRSGKTWRLPWKDGRRARSASSALARDGSRRALAHPRIGTRRRRRADRTVPRCGAGTTAVGDRPGSADRETGGPLSRHPWERVLARRREPWAQERGPDR